jgi:hypothetical protein
MTACIYTSSALNFCIGFISLNFTLIDFARTLEAALLLALIIFVPGFVVGWAANILRFRNRRLALQVLLSTPLGVAVAPIMIFLTGRYPYLLWTILAGAWIFFSVLMIRLFRRTGVPRISLEIILGLGFVAAWTMVVLVVLADWQWHQRLYFSVPAYDHCVRTAFTAAGMRRIPPINPFFAGTPAIVLRYHFFWMLVCSMICRLAGVMPRHAMYGSVIWAGIALMSTIGLAFKFFLGITKRIEQKTLIAFGLLAVTGLDLLPTLYVYSHHNVVYPDMEWWNTQITSWADTLLWTPHHLMALVACFTGFLVLRQPASTRRDRVIGIMLAGAAFASAVGLSTLVTFTFVIFIAGWILVAVHYQWWDEVAPCFSAGAVAVLAALPFLRILASSGTAFNGSSSVLEFAVREFPLIVRGASRFHQLKLALLLPLNYFLELGFFLLVAVLRWRMCRKNQVPVTRAEMAAWTMLAVSFVIGSFVRSTTLSFNDLGWRCFLQGQFVLLLWGALLLDDWWTSKPQSRRLLLVRTLAYGLLALGAMGSAYQVAMLRLFPILYDRNQIAWAPSWLDGDHHLGDRVFALRTVYDKLWTELPPNEFVQYNPLTLAYIPHLLYSGHDAPMGIPLCGVVFGGDIRRCKPRVDEIASLFVTPEPEDSGRLDATCRQYGIGVIVVEDTDKVWKQPGSWVWTRSPLIANEYVRAFRCGIPGSPGSQ